MKRKGFTLVELLIVIVVIGILSAMMMLSSTEAVTSAKASNIVSNLRNLKTAALAYYVDNLDYLESTTATANNTTSLNLYDVAATGTDAARKGIRAYLNESSGTVDSDNNTFTTDGFVYGIVVVLRTGGGTKLADAKWYLTCKVTDTKVQEKLAGRAKSVGLLKETKQTDAEGGAYAAGTAENTVYYLVR